MTSISRPAPSVPRYQDPNALHKGAPKPLSSSGLVFAGFWLVASVVTAVWAMLDRYGVHAALGTFASLIVTLPLLARSYRILSPWTPIVATVYIACGIRGMVISFARDDPYIGSFFLLGRPPEDFFWPGVLYVAGLAIMVVGYFLPESRARRKDRRLSRTYELLKRYEFHRGATFACVVGAAVGFWAFYMFAVNTGGFSLDVLSAKRTTIPGLELDASYQSFGQYRYLNSLSALSFWVYLTYACKNRLPRVPWTRSGFFLLILCANSCLLPFYSSTRMEAAFVLLIALIIEFAFSERGLNASKIAVIVLPVLILMTGMTFLRTASAPAGAQSTSGQEAIAQAATETTVENRNFADIQTTTHVVLAVPEVLPLEYGGTIGRWFAAPIPRSIWPSKPVVSLGPVVGVKVYGNDRSGVPPGFIGEMYWDFAVPGVIAGSLLFGLILRRFSDVWCPANRNWAVGTGLWYIIVLFRFGFYAWTVGIGAAGFEILSAGVLLILLLLLAGTFSSGEAAVRPRQAAHTRRA